MNDLKTEYDLFKALCAAEKINITHSNKRIIQKIRDKGLIIHQDKNSFYLNEIFFALSETEIRNALSPAHNKLLQSFEILYKTDSTNKSIACTSTENNFSVLLTEYQTAGQGRRGKKWFSPLAANICLSIQFQSDSFTNLNLIPLLTALSVCNALNKNGIEDCRIKWPNDIYLEGKKLAGILVENRYNKLKGSHFIVGIGINVNMLTNPDIDQSWTSLQSHKKNLFNRNKIISALLSETLSTYNSIDNINLDKFESDWRQHDFLYGSAINVIEENRTYSAIAHGISSDGALLIKYPDSDTLNKVYSADVSIKPA